MRRRPMKKPLYAASSPSVPEIVLCSDATRTQLSVTHGSYSAGQFKTFIYTLASSGAAGVQENKIRLQ